MVWAESKGHPARQAVGYPEGDAAHCRRNQLRQTEQVDPAGDPLEARGHPPRHAKVMRAETDKPETRAVGPDIVHELLGVFVILEPHVPQDRRDAADPRDTLGLGSLRTELRRPDGLGAIDKGGIFPGLEVHRDLPKRTGDPFGQFLNCRAILLRSVAQVVPHDGGSNDRMGVRPKDIFPAEDQSDRDDLHGRTGPGDRPERDPRRSGFEIRHRRLAVADALGKDPDAGATPEFLERGPEGVLVLRSLHRVVDAPVHRNRSRAPDQPSNDPVRAEGRLGQEPDRSPRHGADRDGIEQRIRVIGDEQDRSGWRYPFTLHAEPIVDVGGGGREPGEYGKQPHNDWR